MKKNNNFLNLISSDYYKLSKLKSVYIGLAVMFLMTVINFASLWVIKANIDDMVITGKDYLFSTISTANIGLFVAIICGIFIGKEFSDGIMRISVARGIKRIQIYLSKLTVLISLVFIYSAILLIIGGIFTAITGYGFDFNGHEFGLIMRMFAFELLALISSVSIFTMFAFLLRSPGSTIGATIGFYLLISIITTVFSVIGSAYIESDPNKYQLFNEICYFLPYQQSSIAMSYDKLTTIQLVSAILMPIVYTLISNIIGIATFIKRDIK